MAKLETVSKAQLSKDDKYYESIIAERVAEAKREMAANDAEYCVEAVATAKRELMAVYDEYIKLLGDELKDMAGLMVAHGWHSSRVEAGKICREKIQALKKEMEG
jgi:hypothetical protein